MKRRTLNNALQVFIIHLNINTSFQPYRHQNYIIRNVFKLIKNSVYHNRIWVFSEIAGEEHYTFLTVKNIQENYWKIRRRQSGNSISELNIFEWLMHIWAKKKTPHTLIAPENSKDEINKALLSQENVHVVIEILSVCLTRKLV